MYLQNFKVINKTALVTGAGKGIGKASAIALAEAGANLIILSRTKSDLDNVEKQIRKLKRKLRDFNDNDHLLMMGDPAAMGIACCVASEMNRGKFKILKWDKMQKRYYSVQINLNEKGEIDEQDKL